MLKMLKPLNYKALRELEMEYFISAIASWMVSKVLDAGINIAQKYLHRKKKNAINYSDEVEKK
jgi:hypothetical protein